jgi:hypothetical protein
VPLGLRLGQVLISTTLLLFGHYPTTPFNFLISKHHPPFTTFLTQLPFGRSLKGGLWRVISSSLVCVCVCVYVLHVLCFHILHLHGFTQFYTTIILLLNRANAQTSLYIYMYIITMIEVYHGRPLHKSSSSFTLYVKMKCKQISTFVHLKPHIQQWFELIPKLYT